ncbi:MAG: peptidylprolyl isomerase [Elusimicrobia bacterium]|nr:peptidylprolyl isomerase [Elusimicrobiota bacterium]
MKKIIPLCLLLTSRVAMAQTDPVVANVNGRTISQSEFLQRLVAASGTQTLNQMVDENLIAQEVERLKIKPNPKEVGNRLQRIRQQFKDDKTFESQLQKSGTSLEAVKAQIGFQVARDTLVRRLAKIEVSAGELRDFFEQNKDKLGSPESIHLKHILVKTEQEGNDLLIAIKAGADFGRLAQEKSLDEASRTREGDIGSVTRGMLQPEMEKVAFGLKPGEPVVIRSGIDIHILEVVEKRKAEPANLKKVEGELKQILLDNKTSQALAGVVQNLRAKAKIEILGETSSQ